MTINATPAQVAGQHQTYDIYLTSGQTIRSATLTNLNVDNDTFTWDTAGPRPLLAARSEDIAAIIQTGKFAS